jgi:hypothetical protein
MGTKSDIYFPLYKLTNLRTGESWQTRGLKPILRLAGLSEKTPSNSLKKSKKWKLDHLEDPLEWDESSYRQGLYKKTKHRYKDYEARKLLRDPLFEKRKKARLNKWKNFDGSQFTAEQHEAMLQLPCSACGSKTKICVDHDHNTMFVRGSLCVKCNLALGYVDDSVDKLYKLIEYLQNHNRMANNVKN